jgi:dihydrofolate reductase
MNPHPFVKAICAMAKNRVIGNRGEIPWQLPEDWKRVKKLTQGHFLLMGRKTFESLPCYPKPLKNRKHIIVSSKVIENTPDVFWCTSIKTALELFEKLRTKDQICWIFGGESVYEATKNLWSGIELTLVNKYVDGDTRLPLFEDEFNVLLQEDFETHSNITYVRN